VCRNDGMVQSNGHRHAPFCLAHILRVHTGQLPLEEDHLRPTAAIPPLLEGATRQVYTLPTIASYSKSNANVLRVPLVAVSPGAAGH
jgi:hypothetical protein